MLNGHLLIRMSSKYYSLDTITKWYQFAIKSSLIFIIVYYIFLKFWFSSTSWNFKVYPKDFIHSRVVASSRNAESIIFLVFLKINEQWPLRFFQWVYIKAGFGESCNFSLNQSWAFLPLSTLFSIFPKDIRWWSREWIQPFWRLGENLWAPQRQVYGGWPWPWRGPSHREV